jgi:hypothetical protein
VGLPGKITAQGFAVRSTDATGGSALDCDLCTVKELSAPLDGPPALIRLSAAPETA